MDLRKIKLKGENKKNMKTKIKQEKGITLIALVVTIVVLLILAGVSVNAIFNENGLIKKAQETQSKMDAAKQNDLAQLDELDNWITNNVNGNGNGNSTEPSTLVKQITNNGTNVVGENSDYTGKDGLQIDFKQYKGNGYTANNIKKLEILSGSTTNDFAFSNCEEVIIYSNAILENVTFDGGQKITVYSGAELNQCTFSNQVNIKMMEASVNSCLFSSGNVTFEKCTVNALTNNEAILKYNNCTVDGEPYSN